MVLVQAGTELTEALIARLAALGIESVCVGGSALSPDERREVLAKIDRRFAGHEGNSWMMALKAIVVRQAAGEAPQDDA